VTRAPTARSLPSGTGFARCFSSAVRGPVECSHDFHRRPNPAGLPTLPGLTSGDRSGGTLDHRWSRVSPGGRVLRPFNGAPEMSLFEIQLHAIDR
jgi:hypothetical protein